ncbi:sigma-54-dependent transcriptional regulator [Calditrichota bacterium LG25]
MQIKIAFISDRLVEFQPFLKKTLHGEYRLDLYEHIEAIRKSIQMIYYDLFIIDLKEEWLTVPGWLLEQANHQYFYQVVFITDHPLPATLKKKMGDKIYQVLDFSNARISLSEVFKDALTAMEKRQYRDFKLPPTVRWRPDRLIGNDENIKRVNEFVEIISRTSFTPCLIRGESGTGKDLVSYIIHSENEKQQNPFIVKDCEFATTNELLSDIFGLISDNGRLNPAKKGLIEQAAGGTLVLKNIERLPAEVQNKLLLYLDSHIIKPIGGEKPIRVDTRIIAQTRFDLETFVQNGSFNPELYFHLKSFEIYLPPLRERRRDISLLVRYFLQHFSFLYAKPMPKISPMALNLLKDYYWPGNVQELREVIEFSVLSNPTSEIHLKNLPEYLSNSKNIPDDVDLLGNCSLKEIERVHIERVLARTKGNKSKAADFLQISRTTLREKLKTYGLDK